MLRYNDRLRNGRWEIPIILLDLLYYIVD